MNLKSLLLLVSLPFLVSCGDKKNQPLTPEMAAPSAQINLNDQGVSFSADKMQLCKVTTGIAGEGSSATIYPKVTLQFANINDGTSFYFDSGQGECGNTIKASDSTTTQFNVAGKSSAKDAEVENASCTLSLACDTANQKILKVTGTFVCTSFPLSSGGQAKFMAQFSCASN